MNLPLQITYNLIVGLQQHRVLSAQQNIISTSLQETRHRTLSNEVGLVEEIFRVRTIVINKINEKLIVRIIDEALKQPLVEIIEVHLTTALQAFDEETFLIETEERCVFIVKHAEEI